MTLMPCLVRPGDRGGRPVLWLGHPQLDRYLDFVAAEARGNTVLATGYDLKVFFSIVAKNPDAVTTAEVLDFITAQRGIQPWATGLGRPNIVNPRQLSDLDRR